MAEPIYCNLCGAEIVKIKSYGYMHKTPPLSKWHKPKPKEEGNSS